LRVTTCGNASQPTCLRALTAHSTAASGAIEKPLKQEILASNKQPERQEEDDISTSLVSDTRERSAYLFGAIRLDRRVGPHREQPPSSTSSALRRWCCFSLSVHLDYVASPGGS
jgi:hypothetical protein